MRSPDALTMCGVPVDLGARALDILIALISTPNEVVSKKDLLSRVWPDVTVEGVPFVGDRERLGDRLEGRNRSADRLRSTSAEDLSERRPVRTGEDAEAEAFAVVRRDLAPAK